MGIPTSISNPGSFDKDGQIKPPQIEWLKNNPKTTKHLPCPDSSWIESISYDPSTKRMTINTKEGSSWQHADVGQEKFVQLQLHASKGSYYTRAIKGEHATTHILKTPKLNDFPKGDHQLEKPKNRFKNPLFDNFVRYKSGGRYSGSKRHPGV